MARTTNAGSRVFVQARRDFQGANLFGQNRGNIYVVFSYGEHWPLFIYDKRNNTWFENADRYSSTTSKHRSQSHPLTDTVKLSKAAMMQKLAHPEVCGIEAGKLAAACAN
jgi:hypothetical protein